MPIAESLVSIRERIAAAAARAHRQPEEISLMAVSKMHPPDRIREAYAAGQKLFGENRVQEFSAKISLLADLTEAEYHMIGHLQSNKSTKAAELFAAVDSIDSLKLAEKLDAASRELNKTLDVLIEINVGGEAAKTGVPAESEELETLLQAAPRLEALKFRGLMTVPPFADDPDAARPYFRKLRELQDTIAARKLPAIRMNVLSMGMSHDFEVAIEEGSTCVRVGTAIFGEREKNPPRSHGDTEKTKRN
jgi:PLP dependent protein